ncbi:hypothetical protein [Thiorhodovibrio frisius]|nr:hypothetical protein [Thiorhodovibrio frisius]
MNSSNQKDQALEFLKADLPRFSKLYKECFLAVGRGAMLVYAKSALSKKLPNNHNYRTRQEILELFDAVESKEKLGGMIDLYEPKEEGILVLITDYSYATYFVTVNF